MPERVSVATDQTGLHPTFSIVTPCLNAEATIEQTLDSVASQTGVQIEHVVVDGGSTDGTLDLLRQRPGLSWTSEPDKGLSDAVNKGIARSTGDVIGWLNADDTYRPRALAAVAHALAERPSAGWAAGRCHIMDGEGKEIRRGVSMYKNSLMRTASHRLFLVNNYISAPATFVRRTELDAVGPLDPSLKYSMDYDLWLRLWQRSHPVLLKQVVADFRMVEGTLSMTGFRKQFQEHQAVGLAHAGEDRLASLGNRAFSQAVVGIYAALERRRAWRSRA